MATRRDCREWAVQLLFQLDLNPTDDLRKAFALFWSDKHPDRRAREFTERLVEGVRSRLAEIDGVIQGVAEHWDVRRMGVLDRNTLRLGVHELLTMQDIPAAVTINEAVDIAKYFSSEESGKFVNGILDRVRKNLKRAARG